MLSLCALPSEPHTHILEVYQCIPLIGEHIHLFHKVTMHTIVLTNAQVSINSLTCIIEMH